MTWTSGGMRRQLFSLLLTSLFLGSLLINVVWDSFQDGNVIRRSPAPQRRRAPRTYEICEGCRELIEKIMQHYNKTWWKQEDKYQKFRSQLKCQCNGFDNAILTQANAPVGFEIVTDRKRKKTVEVTRELFSLLAKEHPFLNKTWDTCAVVGNGGILEDSRCGKKIDSAEFVIRCNLPPLEDGYEKDVGTKTSLVTANPSIFEERYGSLMTLRRPFMEKLRTYGNALLLLNPFHAARYTAITLRAAYTINDFGGPTRPALLNPDYHINVTNFWLKQSLKELRLSTGLLMVSLALELCDNVHVYGFWPFSNHPHGLHNLKHHYYDDKPPSTKYHAMPDEFEFLLQLHSQGVLKLHLGECRPGKQTGREEGGGEDKRERQTGREEDGGEDKRERQTGREEGGGEGKRERQTGREEGGGEDKRERQTGREEGGGEDKRERQTGREEGGGEDKRERQTGREEGGGEDKRERQTGREEDGGEDKRERQTGREEGGGEDKRERQTGREEGGGEDKRERQTGREEGGGEDKRERQTGREEGGGEEKTERKNGGEEGKGEEKRDGQIGREVGGREEKTERKNGGEEGKGEEKRDGQIVRDERGEKEKRVMQKKREEGAEEEKRERQRGRKKQGEEDKREREKGKEEGGEEEKTERKNGGGALLGEEVKKKSKKARKQAKTQ